MKRLSLVTLGLLILSTPAANMRAQTTQLSPFDQKVSELLAKRPEIKKIYSRSEVAKHVIERLAEKELSIEYGRPSESEWDDLAPQGGNTAKNLSNYATSMESETSVAISRKNSDVIVACANDDRMFYLGMPAYVTTNGGATWKTKRLPGPVNDVMLSGGDPVVAADPDGGFYYAYLSYDLEFMFSDIQIAHSKDGLEWELRTPVVEREDPEYILEDKEWIAVDRDPQSPYYGRLYVVWRRFDMTNSYFPMTLSWSDDQALTWSEPVALEFEHDHFAHMQVGKGGTLFISGSLDDDGTGGSHTLLVSNDGGESFEQQHIAFFWAYPFISESGHTLLKNEYGFRAYPYTAFDVDPSTNEIFMISGTADDIIGDLVYHYSSDLGKTWHNSVIAAAGEYDCDRFMPAVCFDRETKTAWATYYSSEEDPENILTKIYRVQLLPNSAGKIETLQPEAFDPLDCMSPERSYPFMGDYMDTDADDGKHVAVWGQTGPKGADADAFASITSLSSSDVKIAPISQIDFALSNILEQPVTDAVKLSYEGPAGTAMLEIFDIKGQRMMSSTRSLNAQSSIDLAVTELPVGLYHLVFQKDGVSVMRKFVKQ